VKVSISPLVSDGLPKLEDMRVGTGQHILQTENITPKQQEEENGEPNEEPMQAETTNGVF
jgi:hypothetical protein